MDSRRDAIIGLHDQLAAEKELADMLYNGTDNIADRAAYRKARGL